MTTAENCYSFFGEIVYSNKWEAKISVISHADWYISFLILSIYLARKPFWANISIFWFYWYISLGNLFKRVYRIFDFTHISHSETFLSEYIKFSILLIYLARKPFWASISIFRFFCFILLGNLSSKYIYFPGWAINKNIKK